MKHITMVDRIHGNSGIGNIWPHQLHDRFVRRCFQEGRYDISIDDLVAVTLFVDKAIHVPRRLNAHLLWHRVSRATDFLIKATQETYLAELPPWRGEES